ncbi:Yip1-domain-containing protein [Cristinia sonorae]|uniref:Protein YIP n=1 Tax=Cristinia sonorae TaxID=1940300 RepID=A0A8K0UWG7_9AGAR|nr:Yip1-domain-containing protein [Cristinia sonorae]
MAYVSIESDDRMEEGPEGLQFQSFLGTDARASNPSGGASSRSNFDTEGTARKPSGFWTIEYYQPYFDVDTKTVLRRCYSTLLPTSRNYLSTTLTPSADLYGPFWTLTTLIFSLFVFSSLAASIAAYMSDPEASSPTDPIEYNFTLLSTAAGIVYAYGLGVPVLLWLGLRYLGVGEWSVIEAIAVWGYGQFVWIPIALLCGVLPFAIARWSLCGIAFLVSGFFLVANVYPILASADAKAVRLLIILLVVLHAGIALCIKVLFFSYYIKQIGPKDPIEAPIPGTPTNPVTGRSFW